jgi:selenide,water dikinase
MAGLPALEGAAECIAKGVFSSLQPANLRLKRAIFNEREALDHPLYPLLFDPQTAGGLLVSVPPEKAAACCVELQAAGYLEAAVIGVVNEEAPEGPLHVVVDTSSPRPTLKKPPGK